jgi:hypothetical protein
VQHGVANLDHPAKSRQSFLIDLFVGEKVRVIEKVAQEPTQLPHRFLCAVQSADDGLARQRTRFEDGEVKDLKRLLRVPAELRAIDTDEEDTIGNLGQGIASRFCETGDLALHATTSCLGRAQLLSWQSRALRSFSAHSASCLTKFSTCSRVASLSVFTPQKSTA